MSAIWTNSAGPVSDRGTQLPPKSEGAGSSGSRSSSSCGSGSLTPRPSAIPMCKPFKSGTRDATTVMSAIGCEPCRSRRTAAAGACSQSGGLPTSCTRPTLSRPPGAPGTIAVSVGHAPRRPLDSTAIEYALLWICANFDCHRTMRDRRLGVGGSDRVRRLATAWGAPGCAECHAGRGLFIAEHIVTGATLAGNRARRSGAPRPPSARRPSLVKGRSRPSVTTAGEWVRARHSRPCQPAEPGCR